MDERFLAAEVRGRGVTVLSACSHAGIVNACLDARTYYADVDVDLVLGGFHLAGATMEQRIDSTATDLFELVRPRILAPAIAASLGTRTVAPESLEPSHACGSTNGTRTGGALPVDLEAVMRAAADQ